METNYLKERLEIQSKELDSIKQKMESERMKYEAEKENL